MNKANKALTRNYKRLVLAVLLFLTALFILLYYYIEAKKLTFLESSANLGEVSRQMSESIEQQCETQGMIRRRRIVSLSRRSFNGDLTLCVWWTRILPTMTMRGNFPC